MGQYVPEINLASIISARRDQSNLVAANVEDRELAYSIRVRICFAHIHEAGPPQSLRYPIPVIERLLGVLVSVGEIREEPCD